MRLIRLWWIGHLLSDVRRKREAYENAMDRLEGAAARWVPYLAPDPQLAPELAPDQQ